jgi:undecaprenyl pyrophosphate synthase
MKKSTTHALYRKSKRRIRKGMVLALASHYGGRDELLRAIRRLQESSTNRLCEAETFTISSNQEPSSFRTGRMAKGKIFNYGLNPTI